MYIYCDPAKQYAEIPAGTNRVSRVFQGTGKNEFAHPSYRRIVEIPSSKTVQAGDSYDGGFVTQPTMQDRAIETGGQAQRDRRVARLVKTSPVDALLIKGGLK